MPTSKNPFTVLGVSKADSDDIIKAAYRDLVKKYHPDASQGDERRFREIKAAYEYIKKHRMEKAAQASDVKDSSISTAFDSFFENVDKYGRGGPSSSSKPTVVKAGRNGDVELYITLEEAFRGGRFNVNKEGGHCPTCKGSNRIRSDVPRPCIDCNGLGHTKVTQGFITVTNECSFCHGSGKTMEMPCPDCGGDSLSVGFDVEVDIPPGCRDGFKIATPGRRGEHIVIRVKEHPVFYREIENLEADIKVSVPDACLGTEISLQGVDGKTLSLSIPAGSWHGDEIVLPNEGMPAFSGRGYLKVRLDVVPPEVNEKTRPILERLKAANG